MITLAAQTLGQLEAAARRAYPYETCGFLIGHSTADAVHVDTFALSPNRAADPKRHFVLDAAMHIRLQRELRGSDFRLVGLFHSHPDGSDALSSSDLLSLAEEDWIWFLMALQTADGALESAAFRRQGAGDPEALEIKTL